MTKSIWETFIPPVFHSLAKGKVFKTDICIVGTGIGGMTAAYKLAESGKNILVLGDKGFASGESCKTTAQINTFHDDNWADMEGIHGVEGTRICCQSYYEALEFIENTIAAERIQCNLQKLPSYIFLKNLEETEWLEKEYQAAKKAGVKKVDIVDRVPGLLKHSPGLCYQDQAQFHPTAYLSGIANALRSKSNVQINTSCKVNEVESEQSKVRLHLDNDVTIVADSVILATNVPIHKRLIPIEALAAYRSYVIAVEIDKGALPMAQFSDNGDPYHFVRLIDNNREEFGIGSNRDCLLIGGEDHRVGEVENAEQRFDRLLNWGRGIFPIYDRILFQWSAQSIESFDGMPLIGACAGDNKNIFIVTGDSGTGMTHATIGGLITADLVLNRSSAASDFYDPRRPRTKSIKRWISENLSTVSQYTDWFTPGEVLNENEVAKGCGAIMREGLNKIAVYRSEDGSVSRLSAVCPHLKAIVRWNPVEKSWDCPAHGSRFDCKGAVLNGPSASGLTALEKK